MLPSMQPSMQPSSRPSSPSRQPSTPANEVGKFWGFNDYDYCPTDCESGVNYVVATTIGEDGWSTDTGGVYVICPICSWYAGLHPTFGSYTGNYVFLSKTLPNHGAWDVRLTRTFHGLTPGSSYYVGFWQQQRDPGYMTTWSVSLDGTVVYSTLPESYPQYINSASVVATSSSLTLVFEATSTVNDYRSVWLNGVTLESNSLQLTTIPTAQPIAQPSSQPTTVPSTIHPPTIKPTSTPANEVGKFWGFNDYDYCPTDCESGVNYVVATTIGEDGWSTDTGGVYVICPICSWYAGLHPTFGSYTGNYVFLSKTLPNHGAWDVRLTRTFHGLTPGSSYYVGFWQQQRDPGYMTTWSVSLDGTVVYSTLPESYPQYINSASVVATSSSLTLVFEATSTVNDYRSVWLNGVTLESNSPQLTPIPTAQPSAQPSSQPTLKVHELMLQFLFIPPDH